MSRQVLQHHQLPWNRPFLHMVAALVQCPCGTSLPTWVIDGMGTSAQGDVVAPYHLIHNHSVDVPSQDGAAFDDVVLVNSMFPYSTWRKSLNLGSCKVRTVGEMVSGTDCLWSLFLESKDHFCQ